MRPAILLQQKRDEILRVASSHGVRDIRVFGSVARGDDTEQSDVDFLVSLEQGRSLLDLGGLLMDLRDLLGCQVDVVTEGSLRSPAKEQILREARAV